MKQAGGIAGGPEQAGPWYQWGPYLSERAWGTVREDYSTDGDAWKYFPFEHAHARTFRWSEDGLAGLSDLLQDTCFAIGLWNGQDRILKERLFGLDGTQGNHGEDVKEYYWYRDATPSHAWLRWRYHYPQAAFPYDDLLAANAARDRSEPEYELIDTGVFDDDRYWVVDVDYAKATPTDIGIRITVTNAGPDEATIDVLPTMWFRNTWGWGRGHPVPEMRMDSGALIATHWRSGTYHLDPGPLPDGSLPTPALCTNETNDELLFGSENITAYPKDGIDRHVRLGEPSINPENRGTKGAWWYRLTVPAGESREIRLRLWKSPENKRNPERLRRRFRGVVHDPGIRGRRVLRRPGAGQLPRGRGVGDAHGIRRDDLEQAVLPLRHPALAGRGFRYNPRRRHRTNGAITPGRTSTPTTSSPCPTPGSTRGSRRGTSPSTPSSSPTSTPPTRSTNCS